MQIRYTDDRIVIRLDKDELLIKSLSEACEDLSIDGGSIIGLGGALWAELGFYQLETKSYIYKRFEGPLELANVTGTISRSASDNHTHIHLHATVAGSDFNASAGHVKEVAIAGTCELFIDPHSSLNRRFDDDIGLELLDLKG